MQKVFNIVRDELYGVRLRLLLAQLFMLPIPITAGNRFRVQLLRWAGFEIGPSVTMLGRPKIFGSGDVTKKLKIGSNVFLNIDISYDLADIITIEIGAVLGPGIRLITGGHEISNDPTFRLGDLSPKPIKISAGAWLGAGCMILPGVTVGPGAVVGAGAVVTKDVPPNTVVGGVPAKVIKFLENNEGTEIEMEEAMLERVP